MGKKRNRDKVHVKDTDMATDECNRVYDMDAEELATSLPCTPSKSPPGKKGKVKMNIDEKIDSLINAVAELTSKCDGTFQRVESMEKILENTASSITTLSTTVSELLRESTSHKEKILNLGKNVAALQQENRQLKEVCMGMQNYIRRWDLRICGVKESGPDKQSNTQDIVIKILSKVSPKIAHKLPDVVDSVHRLGKKRGDGRPRVIIIQFAMRLYRDTVWRDTKDNHYLKENGLHIKEDLSSEERAARKKAWPLVKPAREEGKKAGFRGGFAFNEGVRIVDKVHRSSTWVKVQIRIIKYYSSKSTAFSILLEWKYKSTQFFMYLSKKVLIDRFI